VLPDEAVFTGMISSDADGDEAIEKEQAEEAAVRADHYRLYEALKAEVEAIFREFRPQMERR
jgi:hypothetical protein